MLIPSLSRFHSTRREYAAVRQERRAGRQPLLWPWGEYGITWTWKLAVSTLVQLSVGACVIGLRRLERVIVVDNVGEILAGLEGVSVYW